MSLSSLHSHSWNPRRQLPAHWRACYNTDWFIVLLNAMQGNRCMRRYFQNSSLNPLHICKQNKLLGPSLNITSSTQPPPKSSRSALAKSGWPTALAPTELVNYQNSVSCRMFSNNEPSRNLGAVPGIELLFFAVLSADTDNPAPIRPRKGRNTGSNRGPSST